MFPVMRHCALSRGAEFDYPAKPEGRPPGGDCNDAIAPCEGSARHAAADGVLPGAVGADGSACPIATGKGEDRNEYEPIASGVL